MNPLTTGLLVVVGVALAAWLLRRMSGNEDVDRGMLSGSEPRPEGHRLPESAVAPREPEPDLDDEDWGDPEGEPAPHELLAVTSGGQVFIPHSHSVRVISLGEAQAAIAAGVASWEDLRHEVMLARAQAGGGLPGDELSAGDFTAARIKRGAPDADPWRLELLGRDGEFILYVFETDEAARVALAMLERTGAVRTFAGEDGEAVPPSPEDFEEARRRYEETLQELANMPEDEPGP